MRCTTSGEVKLFEVVDLSSPPRDRRRYPMETVMAHNAYTPPAAAQQQPAPLADSVRTTTVSSMKRDLGFAVSMFGYGLVFIIAIIYFARSSPGIDPTLDGTEQFAEELGHGFIGLLLILAGLVASLVLGGVGACLGSKAGKTLLTFGCISTTLSVCLAVFSHYAREGG